MSYILDALKKSEQARVIAATPPQHMLWRDDTTPPKRLMWPYWAVALLGLNVTALYLWMRNPPVEESRPIAREIVAPSVAPAAPDKPLRLPDNELPLRQVPQGPLARSAPARVNETLQRPITAAAAPAANTAPTAPAKVVTLPQAPAAAVVPDPSRTIPRPPQAVPQPAGKVTPEPASTPGAGVMPPDIRRELPALTVSGVMRIQGEVGWVHVNGKLVREGDEAAPGVKVEKILENGVQFSYKGYRFQG